MTRLPTVSGDRGLLRPPAAGCLESSARHPERTPDPGEQVLLRLLRHIQDANSHIFTGVYSPEHFSVRVGLSKAFGASADPKTGRISVNRRTLTDLHSDAAIASVLCHELGHVLLQTRFAAHPVAQRDPAWQAAHTRWLELLSRLRRFDLRANKAQKAALAATETELRATAAERRGVAGAWARLRLAWVRCQLGRVEAKLARRAGIASDAKAARGRMSQRELALVGREARANWAERFADEAGLELYVRAGFAPKAYMREAFAAIGAHLRQTRPDHSALRTGVRGLGAHPTLWWRKKNIEERCRFLADNCEELRGFIVAGP